MEFFFFEALCATWHEVDTVGEGDHGVFGIFC